MLTPRDLNMRATPADVRVGVLVLDTGYTTPDAADPMVHVIPHDWRSWGTTVGAGVPLRPDGTDSVANGSGTQSCAIITSLLRLTPYAGSFLVFSLKAGDGLSVDPQAINPCLDFVLKGLMPMLPGWKWVLFLNWEVAAIGEERDHLQSLADAGLPMVLPAGNTWANVDQMTSRGDLIMNYLPPSVLVVGNSDAQGNLIANQPALAGGGRSDVGQHTVHLMLDTDSSKHAGAMATAWAAVSRYMLPDAPAADVLARVKGLVTPVPALATKTVTGGMLFGAPV
jgi:hypothetical protein